MFDLSVTHDRWKAVDYAYPHTITPITFITTLQNCASSSSFLHQVFNPSVWIISFITLMIIYYLLRQFGKCDNHEKFGFWTMIAILFEQEFKHKGFDSKFMNSLLLSWIYFCFILNMFYSNCIYSFMIMPSDSNIINTIDHLIQAKWEKQLELCAIKYNYHAIKV